MSDSDSSVLSGTSKEQEGCGEEDVIQRTVSLSLATLGLVSLSQDEATGHLTYCLRIFSKAIREKDASKLLQAYNLLNKLCQVNSLRTLIAPDPPRIEIEDSLKNLVEFCNAPNETLEPEQETSVVQNALKFLSVLVNLDMISLRKNHRQIICVCLTAHRLCLPESLELFSSIILIYIRVDEGQRKRLPEELISTTRDVLRGLLALPSLEPEKAGLQWLQVVGALCEFDSTQELVLEIVTPEAFEKILYGLIQYSSQDGSVGSQRGQQAAVLGCQAALALAPQKPAWREVLQRLLLNREITKCQEQAAVIQAQARDLEQAKGLERTLRKEIELKEMTFKAKIKANKKEYKAKVKMAEDLLGLEITKRHEQSAVLERLEDQIQAQAKFIEEAKGLEQTLRKEIELKEMAMKQQEKTMLERQDEIYQLKNERDDMKRVQEIIAKVVNRPTPNNTA